MWKILRRGLLIVGLAMATNAAAQASNTEQASKTESKSKDLIPSLGEASKERARLLQEVETLKRDVTEIGFLLDDLKFQKENLERMESDKERAGRDLKEAELRLKQQQTESERRSNASYIADIKKYIEDTDRRLRDAAMRVKNVTNEESKLAAKKQELVVKSSELTSVERRIDEFLNIERPRQEFKFQMSLVFAGLVGLVIFGFFFIALKDSTISRTIFAGTAGIQFVTLFSVVIAIILFGIIDILESRELSALLGGLSGYILGRATTERGPAPPPVAGEAGTPPPPDAATT